MFKRSLATILAGLAAALGARTGPNFFNTDFPDPSRTTQLGRSYRKTTYFPPERRNGERECARRRRQMERQQARVSRALGERGFK